MSSRGFASLCLSLWFVHAQLVVCVSDAQESDIEWCCVYVFVSFVVLRLGSRSFGCGGLQCSFSAVGRVPPLHVLVWQAW